MRFREWSEPLAGHDGHMEHSNVVHEPSVDSTLRMKRSVLEAIRQTVGKHPAEQGGALGGNRATGEVTNFHFDHSANRSGVTYSPDVVFLNRLLAEEWNPSGINLLGFVHSHPPQFRQPSGGDIAYARAILGQNPEMGRLLLPIVMTEPDTGFFEIAPFAAARRGNDVHIEPLRLLIIEDEQYAVSTSEMVSPAREEKRIGKLPLKPDEAATGAPVASITETFRRVTQAYDLERLASCRMLYIGTGGAAGFIEDMARSGIGSHILIDPDTVSETNLATQQVYRKDIGRAKVACLKERILDINPYAHVVALQHTLDDLDDSDIAKLVNGPLDGRCPAHTVLCGFTDNFEAQARVNRLALHFGLPSLCAQLYYEGRAVELTFTHPQVTPACHRCALGSRYRAYLEQAFTNDVTSEGTPIFATTRLNAIKGFIAMALLHHGTKHPRWGALLELIGNRNLIQVRLDPDIETTLGLKAFNLAFRDADQTRLLFDEAIWLPQLPECSDTGFPACPDCGGTGDLGRAAGSFSDTRLMRR